MVSFPSNQPPKMVKTYNSRMTTRSDIIQLTLIDKDSQLQCSSKVIVSTVTKEAARNIAVVLAEDVHTKQNLRCDVIVDVIHSLAITTTTKELFMEEAPEDFEVKAYDDQGLYSVFSIFFLYRSWILIMGVNKYCYGQIERENHSQLGP